MQARGRNRTDDVFDALTNRYRRRLLVALLQHYPESDTLTLPDDALAPDEPSEVAEVELHHVHLPKLEERGFIEWNRETHAVSTGPAFEEIRPFLELMDERSDVLPDGWR